MESTRHLASDCKITMKNPIAINKILCGSLAEVKMGKFLSDRVVKGGKNHWNRFAIRRGKRGRRSERRPPTTSVLNSRVRRHSMWGELAAMVWPGRSWSG